MGNEGEGSQRRWREPGEDYNERGYVRRPTRRASYPPSRAPRRVYARQPPEPTLRKVRKRRVWPILLAGCALGVFSTVLAAAIIVFLTIRSTQGGGLSSLPGIIGTKTFSKQASRDIPLSMISQIQVCDKVGNVTIKVDPHASKTTVATTMFVHESSQSAADQEFQRISVEVQPPATLTHPLACVKAWATPTAAAATPATTPPPASPTTSTTSLVNSLNPANALTVNVTFPDPYSVSDSVDVTITIPPTALPVEGPSMLLDVEAPLGNIDVEGVSGVLTINGGTGNVTVSHAILVDGSQIETGQGNVTFNGFLDIPTDPQQPARYLIQSEHGIDVTLPGNTNVVLDANTNAGTVKSDFKTPVRTASDGSVNYHGPLNPAVPQQSAAVLVLDVGTGDITIHQSQAQTQ